MSSSTTLLPLTRELSSGPVTVTRKSAPSRIRLGRFTPGGLSFSRRYSPPPSPITEEHPTSLSGKLKLLIKSYGWYALGVYAVLSVVDLGISFALINFLGAEKVETWTAQIKAYVMAYVHPADPSPSEAAGEAMERVKASGGHEGLYAMLLLAYTVHKTLFLPFRVGLTAAFTPRLVNWLTSRGWTGRAGTVRAATHVRDRYRAARGKDARVED